MVCTILSELENSVPIRFRVAAKGLLSNGV
jgi:hypothetical protein